MSARAKAKDALSTEDIEAVDATIAGLRTRIAAEEQTAADAEAKAAEWRAALEAGLAADDPAEAERVDEIEIPALERRARRARMAVETLTGRLDAAYRDRLRCQARRRRDYCAAMHEGIDRYSRVVVGGREFPIGDVLRAVEDRLRAPVRVGVSLDEFRADRRVVDAREPITEAAQRRADRLGDEATRIEQRAQSGTAEQVAAAADEPPWMPDEIDRMIAAGDLDKLPPINRYRRDGGPAVVEDRPDLPPVQVHRSVLPSGYASDLVH